MNTIRAAPCFIFITKRLIEPDRMRIKTCKQFQRFQTSPSTSTIIMASRAFRKATRCCCSSCGARTAAGDTSNTVRRAVPGNGWRMVWMRRPTTAYSSNTAFGSTGPAGLHRRWPRSGRLSSEQSLWMRIDDASAAAGPAPGTRQNRAR